MKIRFGLKTCLFATAIAAIITGTLTHWHVSSLTQYQALSSRSLNEDIWFVEFSGDFGLDEFDGPWHVMEGAGSSSNYFQAWLARYFEPEYIFTPVVAYGPEHGVSDMKFVGKLKGVEWIVLRSKGDVENIDNWRERFPRAQVLALKEWRRLKPSPNARN